jgi:hypothetical protein
MKIAFFVFIALIGALVIANNTGGLRCLIGYLVS